ncbi:4-diphosphocytidyl-2-C-methyl-D-erythritol kinase [Bacteroidia bacterium]|nr:4-diphosphocytidyl-2-C-methyl-D-erythritol kinase [Bacteroidia bacterium]
MIAFPNAKINLGLNVVEKRQDGFHNIETVFYPIPTLCDVLEIIENKNTKLNIYGNTINGNTEDNLVVKALNIIKKDFNIPDIEIHLLKKINTGAGLGGGSADASFMLKLLNEKFQLNISNEDLKKYASKLGSDCAFFIDNKPSYATGKGDILELIDIPVLEKFKIRVITPEIHVSTAQAYSKIIPHKNKENIKDILKDSPSTWRDRLHNDFEDSVFIDFPELQEIKNSLYNEGAIYASMTGSGSAFFGIFED